MGHAIRENIIPQINSSYQPHISVIMMHLFYMLILCLGYVHGGNVLFFMPIIPKSNKMTWYPLAEEMAKRGHQVTTINPHKSTKVSTGQKILHSV